MSWDEVQKIRSKAKFDSVWLTWETEMAKKAILKRAYKQWPKTEKSDQLATAIAVSNEHEGSADHEHTAEQLDKYLKYLNDGSPIEFSGYIDSLDEAIVMSLYNSGEKGKKTEQKARHSEKEISGKRDIVARVAMLNSGDDEQAEEALEGLNDLEKAIVIK
jgi:recombinational DNA repair protein RecT